MKRKNGITLIALVVTIIVLLILAGVSITMIAGENGIATKAQNSKIQTVHGNVNDSMKLMNSEYYMSIQTGETTDEFMRYLTKKQILNAAGEINVKNLTGQEQSIGNGSNKKDVYMLEKNLETYYLRYYDSNGNVKDLLNFDMMESVITDWTDIFASAEKHPDQTESDTIGLDYKGNPVDMDNWMFVGLDYYDEYGYSLGMPSSGPGEVGYIGEFKNGQIIGEVPQYIKEESSDEYFPVVLMGSTFMECEELKIAPKIPDTVKGMMFTYYNCTNLTQVTKIPNSVQDLWGVFYGCVSLKQAPTIPENVRWMGLVFCDCINLTGTLEILCTPEDAWDVLENAATADGADLKLTGTNLEFLQWLVDEANGNVSILGVESEMES